MALKVNGVAQGWPGILDPLVSSSQVPSFSRTFRIMIIQSKDRACLWVTIHQSVD